MMAEFRDVSTPLAPVALLLVLWRVQSFGDLFYRLKDGSGENRLEHIHQGIYLFTFFLIL